MKKLRMLGAATLASLVAANAYAASCVTASDIAALETAALQQELMVAAFTCREESRYNQFVRAHRPELIRADNGVKAFFVKRGRGEAGYHSFKTELANGSAMASARAESFCAEAGAKFDAVRSARNLGGFANASLEGYGLCPGVRTASARAIDMRVAEQAYAPVRAEDYADLPPISEFDYPAYDVRSNSAVRDREDDMRPAEARKPDRARDRERYARERYAYRDQALEDERDYYDRRTAYRDRYEDRYSAYDDRYGSGDYSYGGEEDYRYDP